LTPVWVSDPALNAALAKWCSDRIWGDDRTFSECRCMGVEHKGKLVAVVVAHNWDPHAGVIELSGASESRLWLTRPVLNEMYHYAFDICGCQMVVQRNSEHSHMNDIHKRFGYSLHYIPRLRGENEGEFVCTFTREQWEASPFRLRPLEKKL
jgi:hypothetical protein